MIKAHGMLPKPERRRWKKTIWDWERFGKTQERTPPFREEEALPVVLDEVVLCSECLCKCVFMLGKVGHCKPQITKQDSWERNPVKYVKLMIYATGCHFLGLVNFLH